MTALGVARYARHGQNALAMHCVFDEQIICERGFPL
jgi:hypothetical protein